MAYNQVPDTVVGLEEKESIVCIVIVVQYLKWLGNEELVQRETNIGQKL